MTQPPVVVGGGAVAVDQLLFVDASLGDGKGRILRSEKRFGGNIATALVAARRAGACCRFLGHLPDETSDAPLLRHLRAAGLDLEQARLSPDSRAIRSTILVGQDGQRFIAFDDDTMLGLPEDLDLDLVRSARVLMLDEFGLPGGIRAAAAARAAGVAVVADIERADDPRTGELFSLAEHLILPRSLALVWTGSTAPDDAVNALWRADRAAVVVTDGDHGCWYRAADDPGGGVRHVPAREVEVVDTTGCGDVFHGAYAAALGFGRPVAGCVDEATLAAGECATHPGGMHPGATPQLVDAAAR